MTIKSSKRWKILKYGYELPKKWRKEKDWLTPEEFDNMQFVKAPGKRVWWYALDEFTALKDTGLLPAGQKEHWHGYLGETVWSGVLLELHKDGDHYRVGYYYS